MQPKKIQAQIVTWNSNEWIKPLLVSLKAQTYPLERICIIDNGSVDGTIDTISNDSSLDITLLGKNTGYSFAHNVGLKKGLDCDFILCLNPDVELEPHAIQHLADALIANTTIGSVSPLLLRESLTEHEKNRIVDSAGVGKSRNFSFYNLFEGRRESEVFQGKQTVFANTGACVLFRREALENVALQKDNRQEFFDEDFFAYKEDIDLGWRLQKAGWLNVCTGEPVGFHKRTVQKQSHKKFSHHQVFLSYRNHLLLLVKNLSWKEFAMYGVLIFGYECAKFFYLIFTRPTTTLSALWSFIQLFGSIKEKRKHESLNHYNGL